MQSTRAGGAKSGDRHPAFRAAMVAECPLPVVPGNPVTVIRISRAVEIRCLRLGALASGLWMPGFPETPRKPPPEKSVPFAYLSTSSWPGHEPSRCVRPRLALPSGVASRARAFCRSGRSSQNDNPGNLRCANRNRNEPENRNDKLGFRVARHVCTLESSGSRTGRVCSQASRAGHDEPTARARPWVHAKPAGARFRFVRVSAPRPAM